MITDWETNLSIVQSRRFLPIGSSRSMNEEDFRELSEDFNEFICKVYALSPSQLGVIKHEET